MIIPALVYSFFLFLKLSVRPGLTQGLLSAWPLWPGLAIGVNFWRLENFIKHYNFYNLYSSKTDESFSQNILFAAGWALVALFGLTSAVGWLGRGVVLGVGLQLAVRVAKDFPHRLDWFYQPIKRQLTDNEKKWGAIIFLAVFAILSFF